MPGASAVTVRDEIWKRIQRAMLLNSKAAQESHVKVGIIAQKGGDESREGGITMIHLAAIHEFGSPAAGIPQRSFMRSTFARNEVHQEMVKLCGQLATKVIHGMPLSRALGLLGAWGSAKMKDTIKQRLTESDKGEPQANAPRTIARKGSDLPLVDTGRLINAITWLVSLGYSRDSSGRFTGGARGGGLG